MELQADRKEHNAYSKYRKLRVLLWREASPLSVAIHKEFPKLEKWLSTGGGGYQQLILCLPSSEVHLEVRFNTDLEKEEILQRFESEPSEETHELIRQSLDHSGPVTLKKDGKTITVTDLDPEVVLQQLK